MDSTVAPAKIRSNGRVNVTWRMTNVTAKPVRFRYIPEIVCHVRLYDRGGRLVFHKQGALIPEVPYLEVEIPAGQTVERSGGFVFGEYYSVRPGAHELWFEYDTRLMGDMRKDPSVPWSDAGCKLEILP